MKINRVTLRSKVKPEGINKFKGLIAKDDHYDMVVTGNVNLYAPNGKLLLAMRKNALDEQKVEEAYDALHWLKRVKTDNRGSYSGGERYKRIKEDGTLTKTTWSKLVTSATIGYYDRYPRIPYCRQTAFVQHNPEKWNTIVPLIQNISSIFKKNVPDKFANQKQIADSTFPEWVIPETVFTTITVNNCTTAAYHTDKGDYKDGFGCMAVLKKGEYDGAELVIPEYRVALDLKHRDIIFFDPHLWHGNTPYKNMVGEQCKDWERISIVCYYREKMKQCLCREEELKRAKGAL
jgi:hypothetical protein